MGLDPDLREQEQISDALRRHGETLTRAERRAEAVVSGGFIVTVAALLAVFPPTGELWHPGAAIACMAALIVALRAEFDLGGGFTVPSQLAFVPLLFTMPASLTPGAVVLALVIAYLPDVVRGELRPVRMLRFLGSAWFSVGPAIVLSAAHAVSPAATAPLVLMAALGAQLVCDLGGSVVTQLLLGDGVRLRDYLRQAWVYAIDLALAPVGLVVAWHITEMPWAVLTLVPLLVVLGVFGRQRRGRVESLVELNSAYRGTALLLGSVVEADDYYTAAHSRGVVELALDVGQRLGLDADRLRHLEFAALLHDVGKVAIPKAIINKPGKLDPHEWQIIKTHTIEGQRMLDQIGGFMSTVGRIVRSHHERWDGSGYPDGLAGEAIAVEARIIAVCDTWNAMTTTRAYRAALPGAVAAQELRDCAGTQFDPAVVERALDAIAVSLPTSGDENATATPVTAQAQALPVL